MESGRAARTRGGKDGAVKLQELDGHILKLASLAETEAPVVSCYLEDPRRSSEIRGIFGEDIRRAIDQASPAESAALAQALGNIAAYVHLGPQRTGGFAAFSRGGATPLFLPLHFDVPVPRLLRIGSVPSICPLVAMRDNYDRYAVLLVTEGRSSILGVQLGCVTDEIRDFRPELHRGNAGLRDADRCRNGRWDRIRRFLRAQIRGLEHLVSAGRYRHLALVGTPRATSMAREVLPKGLAAILFAVVNASRDQMHEILQQTNRLFLELEERESEAVAERLIATVRQRGMAAAGPRATMQALKSGQCASVIVTLDLNCGHGWECRVCARWGAPPAGLAACPGCGSHNLREFDFTDELVRLAAQCGCAIEVVERSDALRSIGGVGCFLKFQRPEAYAGLAA